MKAIMLIAILALAPATFAQTAQSKQPQQATEAQTIWALLGTIADVPDGEHIIGNSGLGAATVAKIVDLAKSATAAQQELGRKTPERLCPQREFYKTAPEHPAARLDEMKVEEDALRERVLREFKGLLTEHEHTILRSWMAESVSVQAYETENGGNVVRSGRASPERLLNKACGREK